MLAGVLPFADVANPVLAQVGGRWCACAVDVGNDGNDGGDAGLVHVFAFRA
jgi:hypothetical protein